ncbi:hypothetical protein EDD85DRAFT_968049 [Armillaria nabsnona]|nr:hypothetical protein EDD85DRAFT_968049 [Armillaria nabsnona]
MDRILGVELDDVWEDMPLDGKIAVAAQLRDYFAQLRAIPPSSSTAICSVTGTRSSAVAFTQTWNEMFDEVFQASHWLVHPLVFTHFAPHNVMVNETPFGWKVTGIIDWECAGWLPSPWEYCKSLNRNCLNANCCSWNWEGWIPEILEPFDLEAKVDSKLLPPLTLHVLQCSRTLPLVVCVP